MFRRRDQSTPGNEKKVLDAFAAAPNETITLTDVIERSGVLAASVYISKLVAYGQIVRVARGMYRLRGKGEPMPEAETTNEVPPEALDDAAAESIRKAERERIAALLPQAIADAVPSEATSYIQGFQDGAAFVAERVLGIVIPTASKETAA